MQNNINPILENLFEYRSRKGDFKKVEIIQASIECLATLGHEKTTYEAIAQKVGTRRAHVAYHFSDKNELFKSAIRYILATYQQVSIDHLEKAKSPKDMLNKYIKAAFTWANDYPYQAKVILLFYYFCSLDEEYLEMNDELKHKGQERIQFILKELGVKQSKTISGLIQNIISSAIQDCLTMKNKSVQKSMNQTLKSVQI